MLRVSNMINFKTEDFYNVDSLDEAVKLINDLANAQLKNPAITDNYFGLEVFKEESKEWETWFDDEGYDIDAYEFKNGVAVFNEYWH